MLQLACPTACTYLFKLRPGVLSKTLSHMWGKLNLPVFLFNVGLLTVIKIDSLIFLAKPRPRQRALVPWQPAPLPLKQVVLRQSALSPKEIMLPPHRQVVPRQRALVPRQPAPLPHRQLVPGQRALMPRQLALLPRQCTLSPKETSPPLIGR